MIINNSIRFQFSCPEGRVTKSSYNQGRVRIQGHRSDKIHPKMVMILAAVDEAVQWTKCLIGVQWRIGAKYTCWIVTTYEWENRERGREKEEKRREENVPKNMVKDHSIQSYTAKVFSQDSFSLLHYFLHYTSAEDLLILCTSRNWYCFAALLFHRVQWSQLPGKWHRWSRHSAKHGRRSATIVCNKKVIILT